MISHSCRCYCTHFRILGIVVLFFCITNLSAQQKAKILTDGLTVPVRSIDPANEDFSDLQFLKDVLRDNKILLLGEQSHGEGSTFDAKLRLIKFLHQQMNYEVVSFESGLFDNYKAFQEVNETNGDESPLQESIYSIWSDTRQFKPLIDYIHANKNSRKLSVTGFDSQRTDYFSDHFLEDVKKVLGEAMPTDADEDTLLNEVISAGPEFIVGNANDSVSFFSACKKIELALERLPDYNQNIYFKILVQSLNGFVEIVRFEMDEQNGVDVAAQNPRDLQMARNLIFLSQLYPDKKIICWGASYHFANDISKYKHTALTDKYSYRYDSMLRSHEPTNIEKDLSGAVPMGQLLKKYFGASVFSLCFSSFEGSFGMLGTPPTSLTPLRPPVGSIENEIVMSAQELAFVDFRKLGDKFFYSSALGNVPLFAPWSKLFDGLFFIKNCYPPSYLVVKSESVVTDSANRVKRNFLDPLSGGVKRVIDRKTMSGIPYASIYLLNSAKGVTSNANGDFVFNLDTRHAGGRIILSSIGYQTDTLTIEQFANKDTVSLLPLISELPEVEILSKPLTGKDILKLAEKRIKDNFYQGSNQQEFFYRVKEFREDSVIFNEEASILVFSPEGYKSSTNAPRRLKGKILQFRNTTRNRHSDSWGGIESLWLMYTHDFVLDKDNVLHRPAYYKVTLNGITHFENKRVYDISFDCKKPGAFTTGFGYPAPLSASGRVYIEVGTFAVLRVETMIRRQPVRRKRMPDLLLDPYGHHLVQSYKEHNGKYFLNYSRQLHFGRWANTKTEKSYRYLEIKELLSTDIVTKDFQPVTVPLPDIKSVRTTANADFWQIHNFQLEDDVNDMFDQVGLTKD